MNNFNITVELCAEDRERLDRILAALQGQGNGIAEKAEKQPKTAQEAKPRATTQPEPEKAVAPKPERQEAQKPQNEEPKNQKEPEVTLAQLQDLVVHLATSGKKAEARELVFEYAKSVTGVPAEKRGELFAKLQKLEG